VASLSTASTARSILDSLERTVVSFFTLTVSRCRMNLLGLKLFLPAAVVCLGVLLPINYSGDVVSDIESRHGARPARAVEKIVRQRAEGAEGMRRRTGRGQMRR
jgi:hypothetical protein